MKKGFTLIELLVVIAIIAILAAMLMPSLGAAKDEAYKAKCMANLNGLGKALMMYRHANNNMPINNAAGTDLGLGLQWGELYPAYVGTQNAFRCPQGKNNAEVDPYNDGFVVLAPDGTAMDYTSEEDMYGPAMKAIAGDMNDDDDDDVVGAGEQNHRGGSNALFMGLHVKFVQMDFAGAHPNPFEPVQDPDIYNADGTASDLDAEIATR